MSITVESAMEIRPFDIDVPDEDNAVDKRGHFAAWEQPQLFSAELRAAFRSVR